ncbi:hypothetical protein J2T13_001343 [Paenibacillus sp. DS2015]|uniref:hypothetical protein n=1 Tax=Paenibacillus sp. DS2015 TaxID=3373917 RepID=UPI003D1F684F
MTFSKKMTISALTVSMLTASLGGMPLSEKGLAQKLGLVHVASAADSGLPPGLFEQLMNELNAAESKLPPSVYLDFKSRLEAAKTELQPGIFLELMNELNAAQSQLPPAVYEELKDRLESAESVLPPSVPIEENTEAELNAVRADLPSSVFLERMNALNAALAAGDPSDVQDVRNLRDEINGLDESTNLKLIDPIWNKISLKLPESVNQAELKVNLFRLVKAIGSIRYDSGATELEAIRTNPEFRTTLNAIAAAAGTGETVNIVDLLVFMFGDGGSRKGVEGTISSEIQKMSLMDLVSLLGNKQGINEILLQSTDKLLSATDAYKISSIFSKLNITPQDIRSMILGFQVTLKKDEPAINAMTIAYLRTVTKETATISEDGLKHTYSLKVSNVDIPGIVLQWSKVSGSKDVTVTPAGVVSIPVGVNRASAVIQAKMMNPYGGAAKVIFQKEVTLTAVTQEEETQFPAEQFLQRMNKLYTALRAGDPNDLKDVQSLRDEMIGLDVVADQALIDPVWNRIAIKLPASVDKTELKASFFKLIKAVGSIQYDPKATELEEIRTNPEYRATLKTIAAASGNSNLVIDDFLVFMFGDGDAHLGIEGIVRNKLAGMSSAELLNLLGNKQAMAALKLQAMEALLRDTEGYKLSAILSSLGVTPQELGLTLLGLQKKLPHYTPANYALTIAYIRAAATATEKVSEDGRQHDYSLKVFGIDVPAAVLTWSKVSGSEDVTVLANGSVTIRKGVTNASAVIQAKLVNGQSAKVIFEKEVTLTAEATEENVFPVEQFLERMNRLNTALVAGGTADVRDVRRLRDEITGLSVTKDITLIDSIWKPIAAKLPATANQAELKKGLFEIIKAVGSIQYDPEASQLEAIRTNPKFQATLATLAQAGGTSTLTIDDFLILMFGDGGENLGVEGTLLARMEAMDAKEFATLLKNKNGFTAVRSEALASVLSDTKGYALSESLYNLGVQPTDMASMVLKFKSKLKYDESATKALTTAYIRSSAEATVKITDGGRQHVYGLTVLGVQLPSSNLKWKKVSGSKDVKVDSNGKVTISKKVLEGTVVIQATLSNYFGGNKVIFKQEITIVNEDGIVDPEAEIKKITESLKVELKDISTKVAATKDDFEKIELLAEVIKTRNDSITAINDVKDASTSVKNKAINNVKTEVKKVINRIFNDLRNF